jgi:hypothetical protein
MGTISNKPEIKTSGDISLFGSSDTGFITTEWDYAGTIQIFTVTAAAAHTTNFVQISFTDELDYF